MNNQGFKRPAAASLTTKKLQSKSISQCHDSAVKAYTRLQETRKQLRTLLKFHSTPQRPGIPSNFASIHEEPNEYNENLDERFSNADSIV